jgi:hypothetical protein
MFDLSGCDGVETLPEFAAWNYLERDYFECLS